MAVPAADIAGVLETATANAGAVERANEQLDARAEGAGRTGAFDVWSHTADALPSRAAERPGDTDRALADGLTADYASADWDGATASMDQQAADALKEFQLLTGQREPGAGEADPDGAMANVGATFGVLTSLEQLISAPLAMIPFPAFPAIRVTDMDVGLPHAHSHPPNLVPPAPPVPFPSTGPIIPIPFLSGATRTLINGMPAARCGDMGLGIWCGGYFPMYEVFLGSSSVWIEGARAGRLLVDITRHCIFSAPKPQDPPLGPMVGMTVTSSPNVLIGGVPMPSLLDLAMGAAIQGLFRGISKAVKKAKSLRAARKADDLAPALGVGGSGKSSAWRSRPSHADNMERLLELCGRDADRAMAVRAAARDLVDEMLDSGKLKILDGDADFVADVTEDLYMMASTRTGKKQLERVFDSGQEVAIRPRSGTGASARPRQTTKDPISGDIRGPGYYDPVHKTKGSGGDTDIYYDPNRYYGDRNATPPDAVLNHEMGHAANVAEGRCLANEPPSAGAEGRFPHLEEEKVIMEVDNAYREEFGLELRRSHAHLS